MQISCKNLVFLEISGIDESLFSVKSDSLLGLKIWNMKCRKFCVEAEKLEKLEMNIGKSISSLCIACPNLKNLRVK